MKVYFNHRADPCEVIVTYGFTNDIMRSLEFAEIPGMELRGAAPDPNEGCPVPPEGATVVIDVTGGRAAGARGTGRELGG